MNAKNLVVVILLCTIGLVAQTKGDVITLGGNADTNVWNDGTNRGTLDHMYLVSGAGRVGYVRFDLSALGPITIESASLTFTKAVAARNDNLVTGRFALVGLDNIAGNTPQNWGELTLTGTTTGSEYVGGGAEPIDLTKVSNLDMDDGVAVTETIVNGASAGGTATVTGEALIAFLQARVDDNGLATLITTFPGTDSKGYGLATKEHATETYHPVLTLTYIPGGATKPVPGDQATVNKGLLTQLSWTLAENIATCRVYFGTEPNLLTMDSIYFNPGIESVDIDDFPNYSTPLDEGTYHWRVDCWDTVYADPNSSDPNYLAGSFWSFNATTAPIFNSIGPAYQAKFIGEAADDITASFSSSGTLSYAWFKSDDDATDTPGDDVSVGTDSDTLSPGTLALGDAGYYFCVASYGGSTASDTVRVSIKRQIAHYAFDGNGEDSSENGLDATLFGEPNFVDDAIFGKALWFDGTSNYVRCPNDLDLSIPAFDDFTPGMTVSVWAKPYAVTAWARFIDIGNTIEGVEGVDDIFFGRYGSSTTLRFDFAPWPGPVDATNALALNAWQMFVVTMDAEGNVILYKNGLPVLTATVSSLPPIALRNNNLIGDSNWSGDALYNGLMDDLQVYNYALTEDNIADMYAAGAGNFCRYPEIPGDFDYNGNCVVDLPDFAEFASNWLKCGLYPSCE